MSFFKVYKTSTFFSHLVWGGPGGLRSLSIARDVYADTPWRAWSAPDTPPTQPARPATLGQRLRRFTILQPAR